MKSPKTLTFFILAMDLIVVPSAWAQQKPFTKDQVQSLVRSGLGDESGVKLVEQRGIDFVPADDFIQTLKVAGASETFLQALRTAKPLVTGGTSVPEVAQTESSTQQVQDMNQLVGKRVIAQRMPLCQPGTYNTVIAYAGKQATVISAKPSKPLPALSPSALEKVPAATRTFLEDQQKAATVLVQFEDGTKLDTCAAIGPFRRSQYFELAEGETLCLVRAQSAMPLLALHDTCRFLVSTLPTNHLPQRRPIATSVLENTTQDKLRDAGRIGRCLGWQKMTRRKQMDKDGRPVECGAFW